MYDDEARERLLAELDKRIAASRAETYRLRRQRNTLAPISLLPAEILGHIFVAARDLV
jgi:hypothetical protein